VFFSLEIPVAFRYPLIIHEYSEINEVLDGLSACPDRGALRVLKWKAHLRALRREVSAARRLASPEAYFHFRLALYDTHILLAGGSRSFRALAYAEQRNLLQEMCAEFQ